jgi:Lon protease-like protein
MPMLAPVTATTLPSYSIAAACSLQRRAASREAYNLGVNLLPLFPLDLVLLPGETLPLHIFEPRYKEMIGECLELKKPFGIVRAQGETLAEVGCTADIVNVARRYDDGRLDIVTEGRQRFQVGALDQERAFLRAEVAYVEDESSAPAAAADLRRMLELHAQLLEEAGAEPPPPPEELEDDPLLSFRVAASLPFDPDFKQTLLGTRSEAQRVRAVTEYFEAILPKLRRTLHVRRKAGGNGHAR